MGAPAEQVVDLTLEAVEGHGQHRGRPLRAYRVRTGAGNPGVVLGVVHEATETLERKTRGRTYVNARWTGSKTVWHAGSDYRFNCRTRQDAIARLIGYARGVRP
jgi:hypothetical protein